MPHFKHEKYITMAIAIGFNTQLLCLILVMLLFPPDYSKTIPSYAPESSVLIEFGLAFFIFGATVMAIKLADERKVLPAAGFTMLAISCGVVMSSLFEITQSNTPEAFELSYYISTSSNFLYFPAMLLIFANDDFRKWLRWLGLISSIPYLIASILFLGQYRNYTMLELVNTVGYFLMLLTQMMWALSVYRKYRKGITTSY